MADDIASLRDEISSLRATIESFIKSYNENNVAVQQGLTSHSGWREAHEKLDDERWVNLKEKLGELKGMLEAIPVKLETDLEALQSADAALLKKYEEHEGALNRLKGVWIAVTIGGGAIFAVVEFLVHGR